MGSSHCFPTAHRSYEHPSHAPFGHSLPLGGGEGRGEGGVMESSVFLSDLLTAHEPELHKSLQCRQATFRFIRRIHLKNLDESRAREPQTRNSDDGLSRRL